MQEASANRKSAPNRWERRDDTGQVRNLAAKESSGTGASPQPRQTGSVKDLVSAKQRRDSENPTGFGPKADARPARAKAGCRRERR